MNGNTVLLVVVVEFIAAIDCAISNKWAFALAWFGYAASSAALWWAARS